MFPAPNDRLNLRENELEDAGAAVLSRVLPALPGLQWLDLTQNQITRPGAVLVVRALAGGCKQLQFLGLDDNGISENGVEQVTELMEVGGEPGQQGKPWGSGVGGWEREWVWFSSTAGAMHMRPLPR